MDTSKRPTPSPGSDVAAIRLATAGLERVITILVLRTSVEHRREVMGCIMKMMSRWMEEVKECEKQDIGPRPQGPDCPKGFIPVGEFCIPENPTGGG